MSERRWPGCFIVVEGIDGCGSTTQVRRLKERLERDTPHPVFETREPTAGPIGQLIRQILQGKVQASSGSESLLFNWATMALLFAADRVEHVHSEILPALRTGATVLSDRYDLSSLAYQSVTSTYGEFGPHGSATRGDQALAWLRSINAHAVRPDLTLVLDVPVDVAEARRRDRGQDAELFEVTELQRSLSRVYADASKLVSGDRVVQIDGSGDPELVEERLFLAIEREGLLVRRA